MPYRSVRRVWSQLEGKKSSRIDAYTHADETQLVLHLHVGLDRQGQIGWLEGSQVRIMDIRMAWRMQFIHC
jgi:hypothetical protein